MYYDDKILTIVAERHDGGYIGDFKHEDVVRAPYCYLHGEAENIAGFDICSMLKSELLPEHRDEHWVLDVFPEGIYNCICDGKPCTFFRWYSTMAGDRPKGLIVLNSDAKAFKDAQEKYNRREYCI